MEGLGARDLSGSLISAALAILAAPCLASAQNVRPTDPRQLRHEVAVRTERTARFFQRWEESDVERRAECLAVLAELQGSGVAAGARPALSALAAGTAVLEGAEPDVARSDTLGFFAASLDLQVVPGVFEPSDEGRGQPLTVRVYRPEGRSAAASVDLSLYWSGPDGQWIRARTEPIAGAAFGFPGFLVYVRAPLSAPGTWALVPVVEAHGRETRGVPVAVECVERFGERFAAARGGLEDGGLTACAERLEELVRFGLRCPEEPRPSELLAKLEGGAGDRSFLRPVPSESGAMWGGLPYGGDGGDGKEIDRVLVLYAPDHRGYEAPFSGPVGERWVDLARERGLGLFSLRARSLAALEELARDGREVVLVVRGEAIWTVALWLLGEEAAFDVLVLSTPGSHPPRLLPEVPTLVVGTGPEPDDLAETAVYVRGPADTDLINELHLPEIVGRWLESSPEPRRFRGNPRKEKDR